VDLCLENVWNGMFLSPLELRDFIDSFNHPQLGVYFDVGNVLGYHQHPPHWIELLGHRIKRVHVKDFRHTFGWRGATTSAGSARATCRGTRRWRRCAAIGYDRTVIAEMLPHTPGLLEHTAAALQRILRPAG
jgi:L-ribulose-5-phosphate 3-epimerase